MKNFTVLSALRMAHEVHKGQVDKLGKPYIEHVVAVARGVSSFGEQPTIVALLHDAVEDTAITLGDLRRAGVRGDSLYSIQLLTKAPGTPLEGYLEAIAQDRVATLVKVADNAHNTLPERVSALTDEATRRRLEAKYALGRKILWKALPEADVRRIVEVVNPSLVRYLEET